MIQTIPQLLKLLEEAELKLDGGWLELKLSSDGSGECCWKDKLLFDFDDIGQLEEQLKEIKDGKRTT